MIHFQRLHLQGYRRFREFDCAFREGLNIILGPNESGKSTLLNALLDALYLNPFSTAQALRERIHWGHPSGWALELELRKGDTLLRLTKRYVPDEPSQRSECRVEIEPLASTGEEAACWVGKEALQRWEQMWGIPREVYLATACIRQRELDAIAADKKSLTALQQQLRENALMTDLERILKQIQEQVRSLKGQHEAIGQQRQTLAKQLQQAQEAHTRQQAYRQQLYALIEQIEQYQCEAADLQSALERWRSLTALQKELEQARAEAERLQRVLETLERIEREMQRLQGESPHVGSPDQLRTWLHQRCEVARQEEQALQKQLHDLTSHRERLTTRQRVRTGLGILSVALILTGISLIPVNGLLGGAIIGLGGVALIVALLWRPPSAREIETRHRQLLQQLEQARQQSQQAQQQLRDFENLLSQRAALLQAHDPNELLQQFRQQAVRLHALEVQQAQDPLAHALLERPPEEWLQREHRLQALLQALEQATQEKLRLEGALHHLVLEHDPDELRLQLQQLEEQEAYLQRRIELLQTTRELLEAANQRYLSDLSPLLKPHIETYLPTLTGGRYTQVQLGDGLLFQVYHPDAGRWLDAEPEEAGWSAGTLDQIFFACRLGLSDTLTGDRRLPLLLDDPFLAFDEARLHAAMELLTRVAQQTQVLWFTCRLPEPLPPNAHLIELPHLPHAMSSSQ